MHFTGVRPITWWGQKDPAYRRISADLTPLCLQSCFASVCKVPSSEETARPSPPSPLWTTQFRVWQARGEGGQVSASSIVEVFRDGMWPRPQWHWPEFTQLAQRVERDLKGHCILPMEDFRALMPTPTGITDQYLKHQLASDHILPGWQPQIHHLGWPALIGGRLHLQKAQSHPELAPASLLTHWAL